MVSFSRMTRRQWLIGVGVAGLAGTSVYANEGGKHGVVQKSAPVPVIRDASEALARLKVGNRRFAEDKPNHAHTQAYWRSQLVEGQKPFATILGCSDSRVPPELVFDAGLGDLFMIRLAGNIIEEDVVGSMQYAIAHLHTPLVVVLGHEGCGAVSSTLDEMIDHAREPQHIESLIDVIKPGLAGLDLKQEKSALLSAAVEANVRWSMKQLSEMPEAQRAMKKKGVALVGGVYDLSTGLVRFLDH